MEAGEILTESENFYSKDEKISYKLIVLKQFQWVVRCTSQEMRKGFWIYSQPHPNMSATKLRYVGDSRRELTRAIDCLHDILLPKFDEDMNTQSEEVYKSIEELGDEPKEYELIKIYRKLFQQLCFFLDRMDWLGAEMLEED